MRFKKWNIGTPAERDVALLRSAGYPYLLSAVLAARGITTAEAAADRVTFHVTGFGHGVGMSQYGANRLAQEGKSWQEILHWYYTGVTIAPYGG